MGDVGGPNSIGVGQQDDGTAAELSQVGRECEQLAAGHEDLAQG